MDPVSFWTTPVGWTLLTVGQVLLITVVVLIGVAFLLLADRKVWASVQMRKGPNVVGPFGLLQSFADMIKFVLKEVVIPSGADKAVFILAPIITVVLAFIFLCWGYFVLLSQHPGRRRREALVMATASHAARKEARRTRSPSSSCRRRSTRSSS